MVLDGLGSTRVGSNARSRGECQAGQCLIRAGENGMRMETVGKKLEIIGEFARCEGGWWERQ